MSASIALSSPSASPTPSAGVAQSTQDQGDGFSFHDLLNIVNPLQHIPVVSTIYRAVTGDTIKPLERIAGDTLYGGVWGFVSSVANVACEELTGKDFGDTALALVEGKDPWANVADNASNSSTATAVASTAATDPSPASSTIAGGPPRALQPAQVAAETPTATDEASAIPASYVATAAPRALQSNSPAAAATVAAPTSDAARYIANGPPRALQPTAPTSGDAATLALMSSLSDKGIDPTLGSRALAAYQRSLAISPVVPAY